ncbi:FliO/MopB family protein [Thermodesulfatator atlanticus]|uniref:FliO/MopB family protein n=1 Tax=Thermodesulfatator atlanticus TaxID=501497 RepID=UPI0003B588E0|nr:flagellar biosynthetic protein FliO [Thermodesulfatator atlanticus]
MTELGAYFQVLGMVFLLCAVLVACLWGVRRLKVSRGNSSEEIKVIAYRALTHKAQLALIEVFGEKMLLGLGEGGPRLIHRWSKNEKNS